jgi:hypothetical protein
VKLIDASYFDSALYWIGAVCSRDQIIHDTARRLPRHAHQGQVRTQ